MKTIKELLKAIEASNKPGGTPQREMGRLIGDFSRRIDEASDDDIVNILPLFDGNSFSWDAQCAIKDELLRRIIEEQDPNCDDYRCSYLAGALCEHMGKGFFANYYELTYNN